MSGVDLQAMIEWIRTGTKLQINEQDAATYAQLFNDSGFDRIELLAGVANEFDDKFADQIQTVIHRRLLKNAIGSLAEAASPEKATVAARGEQRDGARPDGDREAVLSQQFSAGAAGSAQGPSSAQPEADNMVFPPDLSRDIDGGGWHLVRHTNGSGAWGPFTDRLAGTQEVGTPGDHVADHDWTEMWTVTPETEMLFAFGDFSHWLVTTPTAVNGELYANQSRPVRKSSINQDVHTVRWYNRRECQEDPWISVKDHHSSISNGLIIYGENSFSWHGHVDGKNAHYGANVYIRLDVSRPLQLNCLMEGTGLTVSCTTLGGEDLGQFAELGLQQSFRGLVDMIRARIPAPPGARWAFVLPDGSVADTSQYDATLAALFAITVD